MCDKVVSEDPFVIVYRADQYKTQKMCDKAVDYCLAALKLIPDSLVTSKLIKELFTVLYAGENILYFNEDSGNVVFSRNEMAILDIDIDNINLDNIFNEDDPDTIILIRLLVWNIKFEKHNALKKGK